VRAAYRNHHERADQPANDWQITYTSLAMILVVVFVMLVSYSVLDKGKMGKLKEVVRQKASVGLIKDHSQKNDELKGMEGGEWVTQTLGSLRNIRDSFGMQKDFTVQRYKKGLRLKFNSDILYPSGSAEIKAAIYPVLDEISNVVATQNLNLRVAGHTDDVPISTEEFPSNWELSTKRATNIVRYFIEKKGLPPGRLFAEGFAQYQPLVPGSDAESRKQNRRIEIYIDSSQSGDSTGAALHHGKKDKG